MLPTRHLLCILDGFGWAPGVAGNAIDAAHTPCWDTLLERSPWCLLQAHGTAVGLPSDGDMGNSEVGHNAMGAGRVFDQGAKLVDAALSSGRLFKSAGWTQLMAALEASKGTLHLLGLVSDGNVHSHERHLRELIAHAADSGVQRIRVHVLTDGRDVAPRSALTWVAPLEALLASLADQGVDAAVATGGGRMHMTMDRYEADWDMVARGWACHVHGEGRRFATGCGAIEALYAELPDVDDQHLPPFVVGDFNGMSDGDAVILTNFRGDRAIEISRAFDEGPAFDVACFDRGQAPTVTFAGMMQYDGDLHIPSRYLVEPPTISGTVAEHLASAGRTSFAISETQKFGHVTYFFNGNRSDVPAGEERVEVPSLRGSADDAPSMRAEAVTARVVAAMADPTLQCLRVNLANGDMVGHTGHFAAAVSAVETLDRCLSTICAAAKAHGVVLMVTADHGNCEEMLQLDKKTGQPKLVDGQTQRSTSHSLNPVPFVLVDPTDRWALADEAGPTVRGSIARIGATILTLAGVPVPATYHPSLLQPGTPSQ